MVGRPTGADRNAQRVEGTSSVTSTVTIGVGTDGLGGQQRLLLIRSLVEDTTLEPGPEAGARHGHARTRTRFDRSAALPDRAGDPGNLATSAATGAFTDPSGARQPANGAGTVGNTRPRRGGSRSRRRVLLEAMLRLPNETLGKGQAPRIDVRVRDGGSEQVAGERDGEGLQTVDAGAVGTAQGGAAASFAAGSLASSVQSQVDDVELRMRLARMRADAMRDAEAGGRDARCALANSVPTTSGATPGGGGIASGGSDGGSE